MMDNESLDIIEKIINKKLSEVERDEICTFAKGLINKFKNIKKLIINSELIKKNEKLSDFKLQYLEKFKFLNFIKNDIFPLNLRELRELDITKHLKENEIHKIEMCDRIYSLYESLKEDLMNEIEECNNDFLSVKSDDIKTINIQHLYNNFNNTFIKDLIIRLHYGGKIKFDYWSVTTKYDMKDLAVLNASRTMSAIDYFFENKLFIYRKTKGSRFEKIKIKYRENGETFCGELIFAEELKDLSSGWNIIIPKDLKLWKNPYKFINKREKEVKFIGEKIYKSILDNSHYTQKIFTKNSKYIPLEIISGERKDKFDNSFLIKIINHVQSFPITIDSWALKQSENINNPVYKELENLKNNIKKEKNISKWSERKEKNKILKNTYDKIEGFINEIENNNQILKLLKMIENKTFYIDYVFCVRYRMYPNSGILNYQNYKILRVIFKGEKIEKHIIIETYKSFLMKHKNMKEKILKNIFFYNKINKTNCDNMIKVVSNKIGRNINIKRWEEDENLWDIILCNFAFHLIIRIGASVKKMSSYSSNDEIIEEGLKKINNIRDLQNNIYEKRLVKEWEEFSDTSWIDQKLYSFDATTSMVQISSIICFADNKKVLMQCGIIDPFKDSEKIEDAHETILINVKKNINKFIEEKKIWEYETEIKDLLNRKFIKTIHIPFSYGQGERTLLQNVNKKQKNNEKWEKIPKKIKKMICDFVYNEILKIYNKDLKHVLEARDALEDGYRTSSINIGGEIINMPIQSDISDVHIEYWELIKKCKSIRESLKKINENYEFYEEKKNDLLKKITNIEARIKKIEEDYEEKDLVKRINISSIIWNEESKNFKTMNKYKVIYLKQDNEVNKNKMDRCAYVNCIQNGDANVMLMTNDNLILKDHKIIVLWTHDCGSIPLIFADLFEISYKMALIKLSRYYLDEETDPIERKIYCINENYIKKRKERKEFWVKNDIEGEIWKSTRILVGED